MPERIGVLLMAYGTPASITEVAGYYTHIRRGRPPTAELLEQLIGRYEAIGGASPLLRICTDQAAGLQEQLDARQNGLFEVVLGMKHAPPFIEQAIDELAKQRTKRAIGLVLAPHFSSLSVGEYLARAQQAAARRLKLSFIEDWHLMPAYVESLANRVHAAMSTFPAALQQQIEVVFTAHSLPERILRTGDPYPKALAETAEAVARRTGLQDFSIAWQSAGRTSEPWLGPDLSTVMRQLGRSDRAGVLVCPAGFTSDHLEILYDLDVESQRLARDVGLLWARTESLNADPAVLAGLAQMVCDHVDARTA
jgi:protoporphyrin/coproporphyrin ferrochelatase